MNIYLIGSLRNPQVPVVAEDLRREGFNVFDDWFSAGPEADDHWQAHAKYREQTYFEALDSPHAKNVFEFDTKWIHWSDVVVLLMPAGKSGHLELGWALGRGKLGYVLFDGEPERYDVMYRFATGVFLDTKDLAVALHAVEENRG